MTCGAVPVSLRSAYITLFTEQTNNQGVVHAYATNHSTWDMTTPADELPYASQMLGEQWMDFTRPAIQNLPLDTSLLERTEQTLVLMLLNSFGNVLVRVHDPELDPRLTLSGDENSVLITTTT